MKLLLSLFLLLSSCSLFSQVQTDTTSYAFPIGSKFTLELIKVDSVNYKYHVLSSEKISESVDCFSRDNIFNSSPKPGTIDCLFAKEKSNYSPPRSVFILRNNTKIQIKYCALIGYRNVKGLYKTSVYPLLPKINCTEVWNDDLTLIFLKEFKIVR